MTLTSLCQSPTNPVARAGILSLLSPQALAEEPQDNVWSVFCRLEGGRCCSTKRWYSKTWRKQQNWLAPFGTRSFGWTSVSFLHFTMNLGKTIFLWRSSQIILATYEEKKLPSITTSSWNVAVVVFFTSILRYLCTGSTQLFGSVFPV